ncbi:MAG TPA: tetratricopeptide repeat protein [Gemmataceae bacterium]|nr:tetratricopeptide repeat protein [Gemmataceae bacterium]
MNRRMVNWGLAASFSIVLLGWTGPLSAAQPDRGKEETKAATPVRPYDYLLSTDQAIQFFQQRVQRDPKDCVNQTLLADVYIRKARETGQFASYDRAEAAIQRALELDPTHLPAQIDRAILLSAKHRFAEALALAQDLSRKNPGEPGILLIVGDAYLEMGKYGEAEKAYEELMRRDPTALLATRRSRLAELKGHTEEAIRWMERAAEEERRARVSKEGGVWYQIRLGELHFNAGHLEAAAQHYEAARQILPKSAPALAGLGQVRAAQGRLEDAIALYRDAIHINPDCYMLAALSDLYTKLDNPAMAQILCTKLDQTAALKEGAYNRELSVYYANHDQKLPLALELANKDLATRQDIYSYDTLAWALYKNHRAEEAVKAMAVALKLGTQDATFFYHAGMIEHQLGHKAEAKRYLERALALNPHFSLLLADSARQTLAALARQ